MLESTSLQAAASLDDGQKGNLKAGQKFSTCLCSGAQVVVEKVLQIEFSEV